VVGGNASSFSNAIYKLRANLILSGEFRRLWTSFPGGEASRANHVTLPAGRYLMSVWHPLMAEQHVEGFPRAVQVSAQSADLGAINIRAGGNFPLPHKNKHGQDYEPAGPLTKGTY
jgi:hypothetical protein